jgi:hypothetical protein
LRGGELGKRTEGLTFGQTAWPLYRPDVDGIAYYELALVHVGAQPSAILTTRAWPMDRPPELISPRPHPRGGASVGFVIVSTGPHDSPIPHWSLERPAPSQQLRDADGGRDPGRIYKLDALSYVAEDAAGAVTARVGPTPTLPEGLPHDLTKLRGRINSLIASPPSPIEDDSKAPGIEHRVERRDSTPTEPVITMATIEDWKQYRAAYADAFGPALDAHRRSVAHAWDTEKALDGFGEGIHPGEPHMVALLDPGAALEVSGPGAPFVELRVLEGPGRTAVELRAKPLPKPGELDFQLHITHASGEAENLRFFVVGRDSPSNSRTPAPQATEGNP